MANKKTPLDGLDFDNFDFDPVDTPTQAAPKSNKREAITKITTSFSEGATEVLTDKQKIQQFAKNALPENYASAIDLGFAVDKTARELYNDAAQQLRPAMPFFRKAASKLTDKQLSFIPKSLQERLKRLAEGNDNTGFIETQAMQDSATINSDLAGIFQANAAATTYQFQESQAQQMMRDGVAIRQNQTMASLMENVRVNTARLAAYQDQVTSKFQRKMLELQYRQVFSQRDMLSVMLRRERMDKQYFDALVTNTGLPEYRKIKLNEAAGQSFRDRLLGQGQKTMLNFVSDFGANLTKNLRGNMRSIIGNIVTGAQMGEGIMDSADMQSQMEREMEEMGIRPDSKGQKWGKQAGSAVTDFLLPYLAKPLRKMLNKHQGARQVGARAGLFAETLPERLSRWGQSETDETGYAAPLMWFLKDMVPKFAQDRSLGGAPLVEADQAAQFDSLTRRSIVEIMPGWLARIHRELVSLRTGDDSVEMLTYNLDRGEFTSKKQAVKDVARRLFSPTETQAMRSRISDLIDDIDKDQKLSPDQRREFSSQMLRDLAAGHAFTMDRYTSDDISTPALSSKSKRSLEGVFGQRFLQKNGKIDHEQLLDVTRKFRELQGAYSDPKSRMSVYRDAGQRELLESLGIVDRMGFSDRVNYDRIHDLTLGNVTSEYVDTSTAGAPTREPGRKWKPDFSGARKTMGSFNDRIAAIIQEANFKGKSKEAIEKMKRRFNENRPSGVDLDAGYRTLTRRGQEAIAAIVNRAYKGGEKIRVEDLLGGAARIFDALTPEDVNRVQGIMDSNTTDAPTQTSTAAGYQPSARPSIQESIAALGENMRTSRDAAGGGGEEMGRTATFDIGTGQELVTVGRDQLQMLTLIHQAIMATGGGGGGQDERQTMFGHAGGVVGKLSKLFGRGAWGAGKLYGRYMKGVITSPLALGKGLYTMGRSAFQKDYRIQDIYVVGETQPVLRKRKLVRGEYRDTKTKKPVFRISDIKNTIFDITDQDSGLVIDEEMLQKGFYTVQDGKPTLARRVLGIAGSIGTTVLGAYGQMFKLPFMLTGAAFRLANTTLRKMFDGKKDVYVKGDPKVRIRGIFMDGKHYVTSSGKGVTHIRQLTEVIYDRNTQQIVIDEDDLKAGLLDVHGRPLQTGAGRLLGAAGRLVGGVAGGLASIVGGAFRGFGKIMGGSYSLGGDLIGGFMKRFGMFFNPKEWGAQSSKQTKLLGQIRDLLDARLPGKKFRKNSWQDQVEELGKDKDGTKSDKQGDRPDGSKLWEKLGGLFKKGGKSLASIFGMGGDEDEDDGGGDTTILAGGTGGDKEDGKPGKGKKAKPKGRVGRAWGSLKDRLGGVTGKFKGRMPKGKAGLVMSLFGSLGLSTLLNKVPGGKKVLDAAETAGTARWLWGLGTAGAGASSAAAGTGAVGAGGAAGAGAALTIGIPLAIAGALAYGGYRSYKKYKYGSFQALRSYRMAQYGANYSDSGEVQDLVELEQMLEPTITQMGGGFDLKSGDIKMEDVYKKFGIAPGWFSDRDGERKMFDAWFNARFKPIFLRWMVTLRSLRPGMALNDADDELKPELQQQLLRGGRSVDAAVYSVRAGPWGDPLEIDLDDIQTLYLRAESDIKGLVTGEGGFMRGVRRLNSVLSPIMPLGSVQDKVNEWSENRRHRIDKQGGSAEIAKLVGDTGTGGTLGGKAGYGKITISAAASVGLLTTGQLSALQAVRLRTYGLGNFEADRVNMLLKMERDMLSGIRISSTEPATVNISMTEAFDRYGLSFGLTPNNDEDRNRWLAWYQYRFVPTVLAYASAAARLLATTDLSNLDTRLKASQKFEVAQAVSQARVAPDHDIPVWRVHLSPWGPKERLNDNIQTIHGPLMTLKAGVKTDPVGEERIAGVDAKVKQNQAALEEMTNKGKAKDPTIMDRVRNWFLGSPASRTILGRATDSASKYAARAGQSLSSGYQQVSTYAGKAYEAAAGAVSGAAGGALKIFGSAANHPGNGTGGDINSLPAPGVGHDSKDIAIRKAAVASMIAGAARMVGVDPLLMMTIAGVESAFQATVKAGTSTAKGLYQFIDDTWRGMLSRYGKKYGIAPGTSPYDPRANALLGAEFLKENASYLRKTLKREPTDTDLYLAHFMGPGGAAKMLQMDAGVNAVRAFPKAASANKPIFYNKDGSARTVGQVMEEIERRVARYRHGPAQAGGKAGPQSTASASPNPNAAKMGAAVGGSAPKADFSDVKGSVSSTQQKPSVNAAVAATAPITATPASGTPTLATPTPSPTQGAPRGPSPDQLNQYRQTELVDSSARSRTVQENISMDETNKLLKDQLETQKKMEGHLGTLVKFASESARRPAVAPAEPKPNDEIDTRRFKNAGLNLPEAPISVRRRISAM